MSHSGRIDIARLRSDGYQECRSIDQAETWRPELGDRIDERMSSKALSGDWEISMGPLAVSFISGGVYLGS